MSVNDPLLPRLSPSQSYWVPKRYILTALAFLGFFNVYALRVCFSVGVLPMSEAFGWGAESNGVLLAAFFAGYIVLQIPGGVLAVRFGGKRLLLVAVGATAALTLLTPLAANQSKWAVVALRVAEGLVEGLSFPAMHQMWQKWSPRSERTWMPSLGYSGAYVGTIVTFPVCGLIATTIGWPYIFYISGAVALAWCVAWFFFAFSSPEEHPGISEAELDLILSGRAASRNDVQRSPPWRRIFTNKAMLALIFASVSVNWGFYLALTDAPNFLVHGINLDISESALLSALPYMGIWAVYVGSGKLADWFLESGVVSATLVRRGFQVASLLLSAGCFLLLTLVTSKSDAVLLLTLANSMLGLSAGGAVVNHMDIGPEWAGVLMGVANCFGTLPGILAPLTTSAILGNNVASEAAWANVFYVAAAIVGAGALVFGLFGSAERQF
jgi:ACS family sodium-dependent inorganic phosphate cotransporter